MKEEEYNKLLKQYHKCSNRHILVVETDMPDSDIQKVVALSHNIRKAGNELVARMKKKYEQLLRTKRYRKLLQRYGETEDKTKRKELANQMKEMQKAYQITWEFCRAAMIPIGKKYRIDAVFALTKAEDVWRGIEMCLYKNGKTIHFSSYQELPCIRAKQRNRGIPISVKEDKLQFKLGTMVFGIQGKDRFQKEEIQAVLSYLAQPEQIDKKAVEIWRKEETCIDTYRPCYVTLVPKWIRGRYRVYVHLTIEGKAK